MVVCLMRISSKSRKLIAVSNAIFIGFSILLQTLIVLLKSDKLLEFYNIGIFKWLWSQDSLFIYSHIIASLLLLFSILLLVIVFDVATSQESDHFHVDPKSYSLPIYLLFVSFILCILSYTLSLRVSAEFDSKMKKLLMNSYLGYEKSSESRRLVDRIHVEYSCCGVNSIDDFVDLSEIDGKLPTQTKLWSCSEWEYCGVPLSCCKSISCSQRVELLNDGWDPMNITEKWFNKEGCLDKMDNAFLFFNYPNFLLTDFVMILVLGFHLCSFILSQILVTASATLHGANLETTESSYAWLLSIGQPDPASLMKKLNPDLFMSEFDSSNVDSSNVEGHEGVPTETESAAETENATTFNSSSNASESTLISSGTTNPTLTTITNNNNDTTKSVVEKETVPSTNGIKTQVSDAGPTTKNQPTALKTGQKVAKPAKTVAKTKENQKASGNQKNKPKTFKKPSGVPKSKNTKKPATKKSNQNKKPAAKPKKK